MISISAPRVSTPWKQARRAYVSFDMPSSRDIQRRVERLERTSVSETRRFVFDVRAIAAALGEDAGRPQPDTEATTYGEYAIPVVPR
jgi:hypothetical protein